jgi:hypothetical protein
MAAVLESKRKKSGVEIKNSTSEKMSVTTRMVSALSLLMKRRIMAPTMGKKIKNDRIGIPKIVMNPTPFYQNE